MTLEKIQKQEWPSRKYTNKTSMVLEKIQKTSKHVNTYIIYNGIT